jgi:DNA-binding Xre family transcriptional regulator
MSVVKKCTACHKAPTKNIIHPLLYVPICDDCYFHYNNGEFTIEDGNEIFCRFCGEGEGKLFLCDTCPKSFCARCIECSMGKSELRRIEQLSDRWHCFICSPQPIQDLCLKNGWNFHGSKELVKKYTRKGLIYADISRGREKFEIPVINEVDNAPPPLDFVYVTAPVAGAGVILTNNPSHLSCCSCTDNCRDPTKCECALMMGGSFAYDSSGVVMTEKPDGIYECNAGCACNARRCKNRVVGNGPHLRLEVFRCDNPLKGWGVRCKNDILPGTYVADYLGEVLLEEDSEKRGLELNDEYLLTLDAWGRSCAMEKLNELGIKSKLHTLRREEDMDVTTMTRENLCQYLDPDLVDLLEKKGAISRALEMGRRLREDPSGFLQTQLETFSNPHLPGSTPLAGKARGGVKAGLKSPTGKKLKARPLDLDADDLDAASDDDSTVVKKPRGKVAADRHAQRSWLQVHQVARQKALDQGISIMADRTMMEVEESTQTYTVDGR